MDDERWQTLYQLLSDFAPRRGQRQQYRDALILAVYLWSVLRRKPRSWACNPRNAPRKLRDMSLPSPAQLSRRLREPRLNALWQRFVTQQLQRQPKALCLLGCFVIDGRALPVNRYSKDKQASAGWAGDDIRKGYKLFLMADTSKRIVRYQVHAMNRAEQTLARELIPCADKPGYLLADSVYDTNALHQSAAQHGLQLLSPRKTPNQSIGVRAASAPRLHAIAMLETPNASRFGPTLYEQRTVIERIFAVMASATVGLDSLPPWVRTLKRVRLWVDAMILFYLQFAPRQIKELQR
jgi:hypothetical protein